MKIEIDKHIIIDPEICHGKPTFKGTKIMAWQVLEMLEAGVNVKEIIEAFPSLTPKVIKALDINKDAYLLRDEAGNFVVVEKLQKLDQVTNILSARAKEKKITKEDVLKILKKIQAEKCKKKKKDMFGADPVLKKKGTMNLRDEYDRNL